MQAPRRRDPAQTRVDVLHTDPFRRRAAVEFVRIDTVALYALRDRLLADPHGAVRAAAAERFARLGQQRFAGPDQQAPTRVEVLGWLLAGLEDPLPSVRELCCRGLARHGEAAVEPRIAIQLEAIVAREAQWRVRRAAVRALAASSGRAAIPILLRAVDDPFWRVRHAVLQALESIVERVDEDQREALREQILADAREYTDTGRAALAYLAGGWPEGDAQWPERLGYVPAPGLGLELGDPDPAVVTARLMAAEQVEVPALVRLLAESHTPLRDEAARRLCMTREVEALWPALAWLEQARLPHAPQEVAQLLARLGERARPLAVRALRAGEGRQAAQRWALGFVGTYAAPELHTEVLALCGSRHASVREVAVETVGKLLARGPDAPLEAALQRAHEDPDPRVRERAAWVCLERGRRDGDGGGLELEGLDWVVRQESEPRFRARLLARDPSPARIAAGLEDPSPLVRLAALQVSTTLEPSARAAALADPDPELVAAALDLESARDCVLAGEACSPSLRRRAARLLVRQRGALRDEARDALQAELAQACDPWLRARAAELVDPEACSDLQLQRLLLATRDRAAMVRASASAVLDELARGGDLGRRIAAFIPDGDERGETQAELALASWSRLVFELQPAGALAAIERALEQIPAHDGALREHLEALGAMFGRPLELAVPLATRTRRAEPPNDPVVHVERRMLGRTGIELAPLVISGAHDPSPKALARAARAGVDTLFWEPRHTTATRFLRGQGRGMQVIAGSFHADRRGIERDIELARRRLERDQIDVFLLFWVRSVARLNPETLELLRSFQQRGWIRSFGFSTHDRAIASAAIETGDWPVVMARHSAAHPGAEQELLVSAAAAGVGVLGFSSLCYGRMLQPSSVFESGPPAPDCYRYTLSQAAVAACLSAPRRERELDENLAVLGASTLDAERCELLRAHGREVYADNERFNRLVRRGGAGPLREAILELFDRCAEPNEAASEAAVGPNKGLQ